MATKKAPGTGVAARTSGTALATVDAELANEVANLKSAISQPSGNKIKFEASGDIILPDGQNLGNRVEVVVLDFISANRFYASAYNPNAISPPDCFSLGRALHDMVPDDTAPEKQHDDCKSCPLNQFGSDANGRGKACKNSRELAVLLLDPNDPEAHNDPNAPIYTISLPPTAIKSFDGFVGYVVRSLAGPPVKAIVSVTAKNAGTYAAISFVDPEPNPDYALHYGRRGECEGMLFRKPDYAALDAAPKKPVRGAARPGTTAGRRR